MNGYEKLYSLPELFEEVSGCAWRIRRLKADIFTASARGIEILYAKQVYNDALRNESNGDTSALGSEQFAEIVAAKLAKAKSRGKRGAKQRYDPRSDKRIVDAWNTGQYRTAKDLAEALGVTYVDVKAAMDRHRKRK
ncbi:MAG: hypothetical protein IT427_02030 [Pirellulales bacterium]|nr:hypothetical protein [Pirellulales bacterium]